MGVENFFYAKNFVEENVRALVKISNCPEICSASECPPSRILVLFVRGSFHPMKMSSEFKKMLFPLIPPREFASSLSQLGKNSHLCVRKNQ